jgi:hypothetical protein
VGRSVRTRWLWALRGASASASGLDVPGFRRRIAWAELGGTDWKGPGYVYPLKKGGKLKVPSDVPNAMFLDRLIEDQAR